MLCVWSPRGGDVSTLRVGVRLSAGLCQGTQTRLIPTREKVLTVHTHTESAQHHRANTRVAQAHDTHVGMCQAQCATRSAGTQIVAQRGHATHARRTRTTCQCITLQCAQHCAQTARGVHCKNGTMLCAQSCHLSSPPPATDHLPFSGGLRTEFLLALLIFSAAEVRLLTGLCQGTPTRAYPTREKGTTYTTARTPRARCSRAQSRAWHWHTTRACT